MTENNSLDHQKESPITKELIPFREKLSWLMNKVKKNAVFKFSLINNAPKTINQMTYMERMEKIDFTDNGVVNLINKIPKEQQSFLIRKAAFSYHRLWWELSFEEVLQSYMDWEKESDIILESFKPGNRNIFYLANVIKNAINEWKDPLKEKILVPENTHFSDENIIKSLEDNEGSLNFEMLPENIQKELLDWIESEYRDRLDIAIDDFWLKNPWTAISASFDDENVFELYVKYYNVTQKIKNEPILVDILSNEDKQELRQKFNTDIRRLWKNISDSDIDIKYLEEQEKMDKRIREENQKRIEQWKKRNKEINSKITGKYGEGTDFPKNSESVEKTIDIQSASWADIAKNMWLWKQLSEEYSNKNEQMDSNFNERIFWVARSKFIESHSDLKNFITMKTMHKLYDNNSNTIKGLEDSVRDRLKIIFKNDENNLTKIYNNLSFFPNEINNAKEDLLKYAVSKKNFEDENKNNYAIGAIIDNVRDAFSVASDKEDVDDKNWNFNWFKLDEKQPVKKIWSDIIISGSFEWSNIKVRYDLDTGKLFMNSFLHKLSMNKFKIWDDSLFDLQIGQIKPFNNILNDYDKPSQHSEKNAKGFVDPSENTLWNDSLPSANEINNTLYSQMNLIGDAIKLNSKSQAYKNSAIINFMKTFNVMSDSWRFNSFDFNNWSNLFDVIQILDNSDSPNLEYFNDVFMPTVMEYSWLKYWEKNIIQDKKNPKSEKIFEYEGDNSNRIYLKDKVANFNPEQFSWIANFDRNNQLWFADLVKQKITSWKEPNWKLDSKKMSDFIKDLEGKNESSPNSVI